MVHLGKPYGHLQTKQVVPDFLLATSLHRDHLFFERLIVKSQIDVSPQSTAATLADSIAVSRRTIKSLVASVALVALGSTAMAAEPYVNATVGGVLVPGVYGQIQIGNAPPPPVLYPRPVVIVQPAVVVQQEPMYLYVPPGHAKKWAKHCGKYNACGRPVYFVNMDRYQRERGRDRDDDDHDRGHGKGHGKGHDRRD